MCISTKMNASKCFIVVSMLLLNCYSLAKAASEKKMADFDTCNFQGQQFGGPQNGFSETFQGRSPLDCARTCLQHANCTSVNVCWGDRPAVECTMAFKTLSPKSMGGPLCADMGTPSSLGCFVLMKSGNNMITTPETTTMQTTKSSTEPATTVPPTTTPIESTTTKVESTTTTTKATPPASAATTSSPAEESTAVVCLYGGVPDGQGGCACVPPYGGSRCQRFLRDCQDVVESGCKSRSPSQEIFPINYNFHMGACWVGCEHNKDNQVFTVVLKRNESNAIPTDQTNMTRGFGKEDASPFFVGLRPLHHLTHQARYDMHIKVRFDVGEASGLYKNFKIDNASTHFRLHYDDFFMITTVGVPQMDEGFAPKDPRIHSPPAFSGPWLPIYMTCPRVGWFDGHCDGFTPFADNLTWSVGGAPRELNFIQFSLVRTGGHFTD